MRFLPLAALILLSSCGSEPENVQAKAENLSRQLEERANAITAEAENAVAAETGPLDNEADALLNQLGANTAADNSTANAQ